MTRRRLYLAFVLKLIYCLSFVFCLFGSASLFAQIAPPKPGGDSSVEPNVLTVIDPYIEIHSGPGRGYPVFYVIEQGESIKVLTRRPGWYEIKANNGRIGWASTAQIGRTIQSTGEPADLPSVGYGDYIKNSFVTGLSAGQISSGELSGFDMFSLNAGYRALSWLAFDLELGRLFGADGSGDLYAFNLYLEPYSHWRISPYLMFGIGEMQLGSQPKLPLFSSEKASLEIVGLGASYYLGRNFVINAGYRWYDASFDSQDLSDESLGAWRLGFTTFF